jgi:hypothetical protein
MTQDITNKTAETNNETSIETMERNFPNSRANQIAALELGQSYSESVRLDLSIRGDHKSQMTTLKTNLRSTVNKAANNAEKRSGKKYVIEGGEFFTRSNDLMITVVATRVS